jgi:hypothetical protein
MKAPHPTRAPLAAALMATLVSACATSPTEPVSEKLDPTTATTVTVIDRPIELYAQNGHGAVAESFAYMAPFETDRMGERALFLWVAAPQEEGLTRQAQVLCNGQILSLEPLSDKEVPSNAPHSDKIDLSQLSLSQPPYDAPVPWSGQWYFRLPADGLKCLADGNGIALETHAAGVEAQRFTADRKKLASLDAFTRRY